MVGRTLGRFLGLVLFAAACAKAPASTNDGTSTSSATEADPTTSSGTTTSSTTTSDTIDTSADGTACCEVHDGIGCEEAAVQACVCEESAECCTFGWDELCVDRAMACDATCMPDPPDPTTGGAESTDEGPVTDPDTGPDDSTTGPAPTNEGPCCEVAGNGVGCGDAEVTACTCALDPYCCDTFWDEYCVAIASQSCAIDCANDCCMAHDAVACNDIDVFACTVEANEPCYDAWTAGCVDTATAQCDLMCG